MKPRIGDFQVVLHLCFKASSSSKRLIWKLVLFTCKFWFIYMWIKLIFLWKALHLDSFWNRQKATQKWAIEWTGCHAYVWPHRLRSNKQSHKMIDFSVFLLSFPTRIFLLSRGNYCTVILKWSLMFYVGLQNALWRIRDKPRRKDTGGQVLWAWGTDLNFLGLFLFLYYTGRELDIVM